MNTWLPIKKEYIIENFDSLLSFLGEADFRNREDKFLTETIEKLKDVAESIMAESFSHKLGVKDSLDDVWIKNVKMVSASIYASFKIGMDIRQLTVGLIDNFVINQIIDDAYSFNKVRNILIRLANDAPIVSLPYSLRDLMTDDFNPRLFAKKLLSIQFKTKNNETLIFETKGQCVFHDDDIDLIPRTTSQLKNTKLKPLGEIGLNVNLLSDNKKKLGELDFLEQVAMLSLLLNTLSDNTPDTAPKLKTYSNEDTFFVEVIEFDPIRNKIVCRSLDPAYEPVTLTLKIPLYHPFNSFIRVTNSKFSQHLKIGQKLKVSFFEKDENRYLSFIGQLNDYYYDINGLPDSQIAIFVKNYAMGTTWLTEMGKMVNIMDNDKDYQIAEAESLDSQYGVQIYYRSVNTDKSGKIIINADRTGDLIEDIARDEFINTAIDNIVIDLYEYWDMQCPAYATNPAESRKVLPPSYVECLCHLLAMQGDDIGFPHFERYITTIAANALAIMLDSKHDMNFCEYNLQFLRALWAFAEDMANRWLTEAKVPAELDNIESIRQKNEVLKILSNYKDNDNFKLSDIGNAIDVERISHLVKASNTLIGNISTSEINRIKKTISQCLGIESLYKEKSSDKMWFGEENDMVEFKTSIVFPPARNGNETPIPNPNIQIWQILKTINGFLNSLHGGTLLLGVNDFGNASGIENDINWLYTHNLIFANTIDRYIQFIKLRVDNAYEAYKRKDKGREITSTRVRYTSFQSDGYSILRIDVQPYEMGCVKLCSNLMLPNNQEVKRPEFIKEAYLRNAITTEELTERLRNKIEADKRSVIKDSEKQSLIAVQEAIESAKLIKLNNYHSSNSVSDRILAPVDLLPLRGLVVGIEKGKKDAKIFKLTRCSSVEVLDEKFKPSTRHTYRVDPFNMLTSSSSNQFNIHLKLNRLAGLLLKEAHPYAEIYMASEKNPEYPYSLKCEISDVRGIGSFCMSVLGNFKIVEGQQLEDYIKTQCALYH